MANTINASTSSGLIQTADTSGIIEVQNNGSTKLSIGSGGTSIAQYNPSSSLISNATATSASGNFIDYVGIPSWVKRITVMMQGVSTNGSSAYLIQLGTSSGFQTSGYISSIAYHGPGTGGSTITTGFGIYSDGPGNFKDGACSVTLLTGTTWVANGVFVQGTGSASPGYNMTCSGAKSIGGTLDRVRITTVNGTDYFDAGTVNILYE